MSLTNPGLPVSFPGQEFDSEVITIAADFSEGQQVYGPIAEKTRDLDIGILG